MPYSWAITLAGSPSSTWTIASSSLSIESDVRGELATVVANGNRSRGARERFHDRRWRDRQARRRIAEQDVAHQILAQHPEMAEPRPLGRCELRALQGGLLAIPPLALR
jgi:hypothetical protein